MAKAKPPEESDPAKPGAPPAQKGVLDALAHAELRELYRESWNAVLFAKSQQWRTVGATLAVYAALVLIAHFVSSEAGIVRYLVGAIILVCAAAVFVVVIYQFWQHAEMTKMDAVASRFSAAFFDIRRLKSRVEANIHRYILLTFIVVTLVLGAFIAYLSIAHIAK